MKTIETEDPLEGGKDREFGWCFTNVVDAVDAAKKVAALFGDRFIKAYIMSDAEHFDNKIVATVDKAGNVEVSEEIAAEDFVEEYIFIDAAPVNHIVKVKCTCTIINGEKLLAQAGTPRIVRSDKYGAEIQYMNNGDIAYPTPPH